MFLPILLLIIGLLILILGGESLVRGASSVAKKLGVRPLVIGLTIVAFGTSAPELAVNIFSAIKGTADIAIGNVIGSNIANILLILGICALIKPLKVTVGTVWKEIPLAFLSVILVLILGNDAFTDGMGFNLLSRTDGFALISFFVIFLYYTFGISKVEKKDEKENDDIKLYPWGISAILTFLGLVGLFLGGKLLVDNAVILARLAGMSEALIGLTIVAVGTSLPELATSIIAVRHGQDDIAIGNIIGSNIFNIFWILGLTSTLLPLPFNTAINIDVGVNIFATFLLFIFMFVHNRHKIDRWQGAVMFLSYIAYIIYLINRG